MNPDVLVTLGNPSTQTLLQTREGIMRMRGKWFDYDTGTRMIRALATFHPAYLLRSPSYKRMAWQDLRAIAKALASTKPLARYAAGPALLTARQRRALLTRPSSLRFRPHDGPADAQQRLAPVTSHRKRAALPARAGKPLGISAGGVPAVSDARQTTTPPVSVNFCRR